MITKNGTIVMLSLLLFLSVMGHFGELEEHAAMTRYATDLQQEVDRDWSMCKANLQGTSPFFRN